MLTNRTDVDRETALQAIQYLAHASATSGHEATLLDALPPLAAVFANDQTALKFQVLSLLVQILSSPRVWELGEEIVVFINPNVIFSLPPEFDPKIPPDGKVISGWG